MADTPPDSAMLKYLDLLLNRDLLDEEKNWGLIKDLNKLKGKRGEELDHSAPDKTSSAEGASK